MPKLFERGDDMEWQPIETAPKDHSELLGWREDCGVMMIRWTAPIDFMTERELEAASTDDNDWMEQEDWFYADFVRGGRLEGDEVPTHWMPLPPPPPDHPPLTAAA